MAMVLEYGETTVTLADDVDTDALMAEIQAAVRGGGGWVTVDGARRGGMHLFVSAGQYLRVRAATGGAVF